MRIEPHDSIAVRAVVFDIGCMLDMVDDGMLAFVHGLRPHYRTAILGRPVDVAQPEGERPYEYDFADDVDTLVYSQEVDARKPDSAIYRTVERRLGVQGKQVVYIDDQPDCVNAARALGWHAILHRCAATTIARVEAVLGLPSAGC